MKNSVGLIVQTVLAVAIIIFVGLYFVEEDLLIVLKTLMTLFMFVLAYNNQVTFKRNKWYTMTYIVVGLLIIGSIIF